MISPVLTAAIITVSFLGKLYYLPLSKLPTKTISVTVQNDTYFGSFPTTGDVDKDYILQNTQYNVMNKALADYLAIHSQPSPKLGSVNSVVNLNSKSVCSFEIALSMMANANSVELDPNNSSSIEYLLNRSSSEALLNEAYKGTVYTTKLRQQLSVLSDTSHLLVLYPSQSIYQILPQSVATNSAKNACNSIISQVNSLTSLKQ